VYLALFLFILNIKPFCSISMMLCYSNTVLSIFTTSNLSLHGNYSLHGNPIIFFFFRTEIGFQNYVDANHQLKKPGNGEHIL